MTTFFPAGAPNQIATGTLATAPTDAVTLATDTLNAIGISLVGTPVGASAIVEGIMSGTTWDALKVYPKIPGAAGTTSPLTTAGDYVVEVGAMKQVRVRLNAITSGSFTATLVGTAGIAHVGVKNGNAADLQATAVRSVPDSTGNYPLNPDALAHIYTYNSDGTVATDSCTNGTYTWVKNYSYTSGNMTGESAWVKQ